MSPSRLEAFSDGVIAIIITVMVLSLRQPAGASWSDLRSTYPSLLAYVLSFVYLGIYWNNHHHLLRTVQQVSGSMLWANLNLLFWLSLFPFCTEWMSTNHFAAQPVSAYGVVLAMAALAYYVLQHTVVVSQRPSTALRELLGRDLKGKLSLVAYVAAVPLALLWNVAGVAIFVAVAIVWLIPDRRMEHYLDHHAPDVI